MQDVFDFDAAHQGYRIEDLSGAVFGFGRERRESFRLRFNVVCLFLNASESTGCPLDEAEREALSLLIVGVPLDANYYEMLRREGEDLELYLRDNVRTMKALYPKVGRLRAAGGLLGKEER